MVLPSKTPPEHLTRAIAAAQAVTDALAALNVEVLVIGSLAAGTYHNHSDIDFLITSCPPERKYAIEALVEDILAAHGFYCRYDLSVFAFDVVYQDEIQPERLERFMRHAIHARHLKRID